MKASEKKQIEKLAITQGLGDFRWMDPRSIITGQWVRMKCTYGCPGYGKRKTCPPHIPPVQECAAFFREYKRGLLFHFAIKFKDPKMMNPWSHKVNRKMLDLEKNVFLAGFQKAFVFPQAPCRFCKDCASTAEGCRQPYLSRPTLEAFGVDVYGTARMLGYPIQVVRDYSQEINRYGLLLIE